MPEQPDRRVLAFHGDMQVVVSSAVYITPLDFGLWVHRPVAATKKQERVMQ